MNKQWVLREKIPEKINKELEQWPELVRRLLFYRGIEKKEAAEKFLNPDYKRDLYDPFDILDMKKAAERILKAIKENERIIIFGDYDADGICASAIFHDFFKKIGFENFHVHIPDRNVDGYGLTTEAVNEFMGQNAGLVLTLDCGITDRDEIDELNKAGIDTIIIDHHIVSGKKPNAFAIVDSKQEEDNYPFKFLCGAGVAFKVIQALIQKGSAKGGQEFNIIPGWEKWLLDAVAVATIADMVPLVGENRILAHYGLQVLKKSQRVGFVSLCRRLNVHLQNINEDDIAFMLAPRINTASRMDHASASFNLLTTLSDGEANWISARLEELNAGRRAMVDEILIAVNKKKLSFGAEVPGIIVDGDLNWHPGVLGLAANRLMDKYARPVFLWGKAEAKQIKGSCRSNGSINLVELMQNAPKGFFIDFGGHALAGGFSLEDGKISDLEKEILSAWRKISKQKTEGGILHIDNEISINDANWDFYSVIEKFQPFGIENPKPVFLFPDLEVAGVKKFGNGGIHIQLDFKKNGGETISAIGFFFNGTLADVKRGSRVALVASLEKSFFRPRPELRLRIIDIKLKP